ncbi:MAG: hypothetical protein M0P46_06480 [Thiopseudomonas sp.]|nr:hypothetical protein [Thiopseudomonas sp.]
MFSLADYDFHARYACEALMLLQPQLEVEGLYRRDQDFVIHCPALTNNLTTLDGTSLVEWFAESCRPMGSPIRLLAYVPKGYKFVPLRTNAQRASLHGEPLNGFDFAREFQTWLLDDFPLVGFESGGGYVIVNVSRPLSEAEQTQVNTAARSLGMPVEVRLKKNSLNEPQATRKYVLKPESVSLSLPSAKVVKNKYSNRLAALYEEDEDFWISNRETIFYPQDVANVNVLKEAFSLNRPACFIDASVFPPHNIRSYLPLYHRIIMAMPLKERLATALQQLNVSQDDLIELVRIGRVQFVLPLPLHRYDLNFIELITESAPEAFLFSRRLAAASIVESHKRLPFMYPPFTVEEKQHFLKPFFEVESLQFKKVAQTIAESLGKSWVNLEYGWNNQGAMASIYGGIGTLLGNLIYILSNQDIRIELDSASASVQWAAALGATYCSFNTGSYSDYGAASLCASLYSGVKNQPTVHPIDKLSPLVENALTLNNDAPVLEINEVFTTGDIERLHKLLINKQAMAHPQAFLNDLNDKVRRFEVKQDRLTRLDIMGLGGAAAAGAITGNAYVPFGVWLLQYVLKNADPSRDLGGKVLDWCRGLNTFTSPNAVLVSRLRNKLSR